MNPECIRLVVAVDRYGTASGLDGKLLGAIVAVDDRVSRMRAADCKRLTRIAHFQFQRFQLPIMDTVGACNNMNGLVSTAERVTGVSEFEVVRMLAELATEEEDVAMAAGFNYLQVVRMRLGIGIIIRVKYRL